MTRMTEISGAEAVWLLDGAHRGQLVLTHRARPLIRPASHIMEHGDLILRAPAPPAALDLAAYHVQDLDRAGHGWQVTATGPASLLTDPDLCAHYRRTLPGWTLGPHDTLVRVRPQRISGYRCAT